MIPQATGNRRDRCLIDRLGQRPNSMPVCCGAINVLPTSISHGIPTAVPSNHRHDHMNQQTSREETFPYLKLNSFTFWCSCEAKLICHSFCDNQVCS
jgi:hypothetical protein